MMHAISGTGAMFCPHCGTLNTSAGKNCNFCGCVLPQLTSERNTQVFFILSFTLSYTLPW